MCMVSRDEFYDANDLISRHLNRTIRMSDKELKIAMKVRKAYVGEFRRLKASDLEELKRIKEYFG